MEGWPPLAQAWAEHLRYQDKHSPRPPGAHARGWVCRNGGAGVVRTDTNSSCQHTVNERYDLVVDEEKLIIENRNRGKW